MSKEVIRVHCKGKGSLNIFKTSGAQGNFVSSMSSSLGRPFSQKVSRDMLRVGEAVFLTDRAFRRGRRLGRQSRILIVEVPLEEPGPWARVSDDVAALASFVSQDNWQFEFKQITGKKERVAPAEVRLDNPCVSLYSDGLDSLCGAAQTFHRGETPVFVSHAPPGFKTVRRRINHLKEQLGFSRAPAHFLNINFKASDRDAHGKRNMFPERTRRTRPMLYLSMAGAVALEWGISKIYLNENGFLAVNLPFQFSLGGPDITRHAHPETLRRFQTLLNHLGTSGEAITVMNPFFDLTKAEEMEALASAAPLANDTVSCEYARQQVAVLIHWLRENRKPWANQKECGLCFPCLIRRTSMFHAGVKEPRDHYVFDARRAFKNQEFHEGSNLYVRIAPNVDILYQFCRKMRMMNPCSFTAAYLPELSLLQGPGEDLKRLARDVYSLYSRFADQYLEFIESRAIS